MERERRTEAREVECPLLVGDSAAWREVVLSLPRIAGSGLPVLVLGETGTGKELIARALHASSFRRRAPFVAHNCGATPDSLIESELFGHSRGAFTGAIHDRAGLFESADKGTLFLDEIGDASPLLQMKLLRVLQEGEVRRVGDVRVRRVDVRIVAATHQPLERAVAAGRFRADLWFRLNAVQLRLPSLRERPGDVLVLARHFLSEASRRVGAPPPQLSPAIVEHLLRHSWPGNVRELANACLFAVRVAGATDRVLPEHWPESTLAGAVAEGSGLQAETRALERRRLNEALRRSRGNKTQAARALGLSRQGLLNKLRRYGLLPGTAGAELDAAGADD